MLPVEFNPSIDLDDDSPRMWCVRCETNVDVVKRDFGIGSYEYWGCKGRHVDMQDTCAVCGSENLLESRS